MRALFAKILPGDVVLAVAFARAMWTPSMETVSAFMIASVICLRWHAFVEEARELRHKRAMEISKIEERPITQFRERLDVVEATVKDLEKKASSEKLAGAFGGRKS